jgi:hypothetical protein
MMKNDLELLHKNLSKEERQSLAERALELEQLEDREYQGTYRQDKTSIEVIHSEAINLNSQFVRLMYER